MAKSRECKMATDNNYNEIAYDNEDEEIDYDMQARMNEYFNKKKGE